LHDSNKRIQVKMRDSVEEFMWNNDMDFE
jgi:hypothetical protein